MGRGGRRREKLRLRLHGENGPMPLQIDRVTWGFAKFKRYVTWKTNDVKCQGHFLISKR